MKKWNQMNCNEMKWNEMKQSFCFVHSFCSWLLFTEYFVCSLYTHCISHETSSNTISFNPKFDHLYFFFFIFLFFFLLFLTDKSSLLCLFLYYCSSIRISIESNSVKMTKLKGHNLVVIFLLSTLFHFISFIFLFIFSFVLIVFIII